MARPKDIKETKPRETKINPKNQPRQSLKRKRLLKHLNDSDSVMEAALKAGYSPSTRTMYSKTTKSHIEELLDSEDTSLDTCKKLFKEGTKLAKTKKDYANYHRGIENIVRMQGGFVDKSEVKQTVTQQKAYSTALDRYRELSREDQEVKDITN